MKNLPLSLRSRLTLLRWSIRSYVLIEGLAVGVVWLGLTFWAGLALDYLPVMAGASEMPWTVRAVLLTLISLVFAWLLYRWVLSRTFVRMADRSMAVLLERQFPGFRDSLVTAVELRDRPDHAEVFSQAMLDHTSQEAVQGLKDVRLGHVFRISPLVAKVGLALLLILSVGMFSRVKAEAFDLWVKRMYLLQDEPWPRKSHIELVGVEVQRDPGLELPVSAAPPLMPFENQGVKVARGSSIRVLVQADAELVVPEKCTIYYRTDEGDRGRVDMKRIGAPRDGYQLYSFEGKPFRGILSDVTFDVRGGDHRIRDYQVQMVESPAVVQTQLDCTFPNYLVNEELSAWLPRTVELVSGLQLPRGTRMTVHCRANKELARVDIVELSGSSDVPNKVTTIDIDAEGEGARTFSYDVPSLGESLSLDVLLYDRDGVVAERPHRIYVAGIQDEPPTVNVVLRGIGTAVTPDVVIPVEGTIRDEYEIQKQWFQVLVNDGEPQEIPFPIAPASKVEARLDFKLLRDEGGSVNLQPKDKLILTVRASDRYDLGEDANVGSGDRYQLDVVTKDELLALLDRRELGLRRRFEQIIDEMMEMRDSLARISSGAADEPALPAEPGEEPSQLTPEQQAERLRALNVLRCQRAQSQTQKSAQEVLGVAAAFDDIRLEIDNNRVDSEDRKIRLQEQISEPLQLIGESMYAELERQLLELDQALSANSEQTDELSETVLAQTDDILIELDKVLQKMLELEDYNALVNLVRQILDQQQKLTEQTKDLRKKNALDLLQ